MVRQDIHLIGPRRNEPVHIARFVIRRNQPVGQFHAVDANIAPVETRAPDRGLGDVPRHVAPPLSELTACQNDRHKILRHLDDQQGICHDGDIFDFPVRKPPDEVLHELLGRGSA